MILQALAAYYDRLLAAGVVEAPGFQAKEILWVVVLDRDGRFVRLIRTGTGKDRPRKFVVPAEIKKSVNIAANLLWENPEYALGVARAKADDKQAAKVPLRHAAFIKRLRDLPTVLRDDAGIYAVLAFLERGDFDALKAEPDWPDLAAGGANVSFRLDEDRCLVCERPAVRAALTDHDDTPGDAGSDRRCLVTGRRSVPTLLHPSIKGVPGGQSSGTSLVAFNAKAYESHGWEQGDNAPVSAAAAHAYAAALNFLLSPDNRNHQFREGDTTYVFWAKAPTILEDRLSPTMTGLNGFTSDGQPVRETFQSMRLGLRPALDDPTPFYVLGVAPNAARLAVRFWHEGTVAGMAANILGHFDALAIDGFRDDTPLPGLWALLGAAAPDSDPKRLQDQLRGKLSADLLAAALAAQPYPATLLARTVERCRLESSARPNRVVLIKALLVRRGKEITVSLDPDNTNPGYLLGRLFGVLEYIQYKAQGELNTTIRDRYFGAAMASPRAVFVQLETLKNAHVKKLRRDKAGLAVTLERDIEAIMGGLKGTDGLPATLSLDDQGRFILGYHHQRSYRGPTAPDATSDTDQQGEI